MKSPTASKKDLVLLWANRFYPELPTSDEMDIVAYLLPIMRYEVTRLNRMLHRHDIPYTLRRDETVYLHYTVDVLEKLGYPQLAA